MRLIDADALLSRLKQPMVEDINEVLRIEYDNAPNDVLAAEAIYNMYATVREAIKDAPTTSPRPDWTPCAEGLPLKCGDCTRDKGNCIFCARGKCDLYMAPTLPAPYNPDRKED